MLHIRSVAEEPCTIFRKDFQPVHDGRSLVDGLMRLPRHHVVRPPAPARGWTSGG